MPQFAQLDEGNERIRENHKEGVLPSVVRERDPKPQAFINLNICIESFDTIVEVYRVTETDLSPYTTFDMHDWRRL